MATVSFTQSLHQCIILVLSSHQRFSVKFSILWSHKSFGILWKFCKLRDSDLVQELEDYIRFKKYSSSTIDLVITAIANALCCKILLLQEKETGYQLECSDHVILPMRDPQKPLFTIRLLWRGEHYDSLVEQGMLLYS